MIARSLGVLTIVALLVVSSVSIGFGEQENEISKRYLVGLKDDGVNLWNIAGIEVVVDYKNGFYIIETTEGSIDKIPVGSILTMPLDGRMTLDFYPSEFSFDPLSERPSFQKNLRSGKSSWTYVVQFIGPIKREWIDQTERLGAKFLGTVSHFGILVRADSATMSQISNLWQVRWIGKYEPAFKFSSEVARRVGSVPLSIVVFPDSDPMVFAEDILTWGVTVQMASSRSRTIQVFADSSLIPFIAGREEVHAIYSRDPVFPLDAPSVAIHKVQDAWNTSRSGLSTSLTGQSPGPDGIEDTSDDYFEVIGIQGSGLDIGQSDKGHPDFYMGPHGSRVIRFTDRTGRSVPDGYESGYAWGTHQAGVVIGNGFSWEHHNGHNTSDDNWDWTEAGVVPEGKVVFDGIQSIGPGLNPSESYWDDQYDLGANTNLATWFSIIGDYAGTSSLIDRRLDQQNDRMIVSLAGDFGPSQNTLMVHSQSKNGLSIGASQNFRPGRSDAIDPGLIFENSSRGGPNQSYGRLKPDLVAVGTSVISALSCGEWQYNEDHGIPNPRPDYIIEVDEYDCISGTLGQDGIPDYRYLSSTAVSAAMAAGLNMLVREYLRENFGMENRTEIHSQLTKALLINGAVRMNSTLYDYPGYDQGWGRIDLENSLFPKSPRKVLFEEGNLSSTGIWMPSSINLSIASSTVPLKVTLVWIDAFGKALSRDLNLRLVTPSGIEYRGNVYGATGPYDGWSIPNPQVSDANPVWDRNSDGLDDVNNVEQIEVLAPEIGPWRIEVVGFSIPSKTNFALVVSGDIGIVPIPPPTNLTTEAVGDDVRLDWDPPTSPVLHHYLIYRSNDQREFDFTTPLLDTSMDPDSLRTNWTDTGAAGPGSPQDYYYVVRAVSIGGQMSITSNTAGKWTRSFREGRDAFSLPLEPSQNRNVSWYSENIPGTEFVRWMNATGHWVTHYPSMGEGVNDVPAVVGDSYEISLSSPINFTFCGHPASMIRFREGLGDSPVFRKSLSAQVEGNDVNLSWEAVTGAIGYLVFRSEERNGLHNLSLLPIANATVTYWIDSGVIESGRSEYYYMVIPVDSSGGLGSSTYSVGVFTVEYQSGTDSFALPLKPVEPRSLDWYCDNIANVVGIIHLMKGYWRLHAREMPEGVYDVEALQGEGYQISIDGATTTHTFVGY